MCIHELFELRHMTDPSVRIGTRGSQLALWQANWVRDQIQAHFPEIPVELEVIKTGGDKITDVPLARIGGKGLFVKEIEEALLDGRVDLAVHSMKDMPSEMPEGLCIAAIPERETPYDVLIARDAITLGQLPEGAAVGTSSLRRACQILHLRPDIEVRPLRGNIDTRIRKLTTENLDAVILAAAGVKRLGFIRDISAHLDPAEVLPAAGQGALCIQARQNDARIAGLLENIHHAETACTVLAERAFLKRLEGGCQVPIAAFAVLSGDHLEIDGLVAETDGSLMIRAQMSGSARDPENLGTALAEKLISRGAGDIVQRLVQKASQT